MLNIAVALVLSLAMSLTAHAEIITFDNLSAAVKESRPMIVGDFQFNTPTGRFAVTRMESEWTSRGPSPYAENGTEILVSSLFSITTVSKMPFSITSFDLGLQHANWDQLRTIDYWGSKADGTTVFGSVRMWFNNTLQLNDLNTVALDGFNGLTSFSIMANNDPDRILAFDNFVVAATEPSVVSEPSSMALMGVAVAFMALRRRKYPAWH